MSTFVGDLEVIQKIQARREASSTPSTRDDGHHIALVIEGGGMRGVAAGGMVSALEDLDLRRCFDSVHGSSAGAAAGAYFVAKQANFGTSIYYEDLNGDEFVNPGRVFRKPIMDTGYLVDYVMDEVKSIDYREILDGDIPLHIVTTDIKTGKSVSKTNFETEEIYREYLKASITLPFIAGRARLVEGRHLLDGGLTQQIALQSAFDAGATHVLALQTSTYGHSIRKVGTLSLRLQAV